MASKLHLALVAATACSAQGPVATSQPATSQPATIPQSSQPAAQPTALAATPAAPAATVTLAAGGTDGAVEALEPLSAGGAGGLATAPAPYCNPPSPAGINCNLLAGGSCPTPPNYWEGGPNCTGMLHCAAAASINADQPDFAVLLAVPAVAAATCIDACVAVLQVFVPVGRCARFTTSAPTRGFATGLVDCTAQHPLVAALLLGGTGADLAARTVYAPAYRNSTGATAWWVRVESAPVAADGTCPLT